MSEDHDHTGARGAAFRWIARGLFVAMGLMMGLVVASDPRITSAARAALAQSQAERTTLATAQVPTSVTLSVPVETVQTVSLDRSETTAEVEEAPQRPRVSVMPESTVTVRRLVP